ncbi:putative dehydrogenase/oxygenase subunit (flavoprotein) [Cystobacter fuscus]|uniref:Putative dehydrogenase/oxygenase subunit (Flavoprotein) n=1 Tax=Cystobacter fuscus TaxID=43 RepID=A0A250IVR1_9BACT|nr:styrene monooxygenase/indole monooxygenase family protein [Cystobacter fuscus]ATB35297.1 putative dehydrogenase/oxygenase subunit (flavoprotein) [Cystobacter fuscus]
MLSRMANIAIVGAGQAGLFLGFGLLEDGHEVTLFSDQTPDEILHGRLPSGMGLFEDAVKKEAALGLTFWEDVMTRGEGAILELINPDGSVGLHIAPPVPRPHRSVDQRLKNSRWMRELERRGASVRVVSLANPEQLDAHVAGFDLVLVATGKGALSSLFPRDARRSPFDKPQRHITCFLVKNFRPEVRSGTIRILPGLGEVVITPFYSRENLKARILLIEGIPGGPLDYLSRALSGRELLEECKQTLFKLLPGQLEDLREAELSSEQCWLRGSLTPTVREPVGRLASGRVVLGLGDALMLHDPLAAQGGNNATHMADFYRTRIREHAERPFTAEWMQRTFEDFWLAYGQYSMGVTAGLLMPPAPHQQAVLVSAHQVPAVAAALIDGLYDPRALFPWFVDPAVTRDFLHSKGVPPALLEQFWNLFAEDGGLK